MAVPAALTSLPVNHVLGDLLAALRTNDTAILVAPPGAGKTTVAPLALIDEPWLDGQRIVMLEPRRLAARAAAQRMAAVLGQQPGELVGYQTRDERRIGSTTRIEVVTEGVLTRRLQHDPTLPGTGLVIFDEAHERNLPTDLGLALALDGRRVVRPDLRILVMSATLNVEAFTAALGNVPVIHSDGQAHPVDIIWAPSSAAAPPRARQRRPQIEEHVVAVVQRALRENPVGDVLVFLPGIGEIRTVQRLLDSELPVSVDVFPLAGALSLADHDAALAESPAGRRRVVLSTDIAESSLTVSGVQTVVDAGLARVPRFDARSGLTRLITVATSRASADQRAGRAGRLGPGRCYRLWRKGENVTRPMHLPAEITQTDLAGLALELAAWGTPVDELTFLDQPPTAALRHATELLHQLGALDEAGRPTAIGRRMLHLPVHPRPARMIDGAASADRATACVVAALVDDRDPFRGRPAELPADIAMRVNAITGRFGDDRADRGALRRIADRARDLARRADVVFDIDRVDADRCGAVLLLAYPDRLAVSRGRVGQYQMRTGGTATIDAHDPLASEQFVVAADLDGNRSGARIRLGAAIGVADLTHVLADQTEQRREVVWDGSRNDVVLRAQLRLGGMLLSESIAAAPVGDETIAALIERVRANGLRIFEQPGTALRARVQFLRHAGDPTWPDWDEPRLMVSLNDWLAPYLSGVRSMAELVALDVEMVLGASLGWDASQRLSELAPTTIRTPTGRSIPIDYTRERPTASARVQDLYGIDVHPMVAGGTVPVAIELLSPAGRPVQITSDLPGFWRGSWAEVRKEMRGRYPKHSWPEDPTTR